MAPPRAAASPTHPAATTGPEEERYTDDPHWNKGNIVLLAGDTRFRVPDYLLYWSSPLLTRTCYGQRMIKLERDASTLRLFLILAATLRVDFTLPVPALASLFRLLTAWECNTLGALAIERIDAALRGNLVHPLKLLHLGLAADCEPLRVMALCFTAPGNVGEPLYHTPQRGGAWNAFSPDNWPFALWETLDAFPAAVWALAKATSVSFTPGEALAELFERLYAEAQGTRVPAATR
ncbi:hypothetical protein CcaverHIS002_0404580 [Cutaneotrichosporon cavernicola]|uniref:BTB domain-containing protein n=1 Tax=Cutaneotrichosporon cavernicola TaxID=279322 RepID=A0AA48QVR8_9TREE|nr:uncharacterized protein CcaverHIS019_0404550 [Cutaneotrichosporon cavernicola]BEI83854.1 hypothetical protein CcaverHIS002_0404580 [Cutaneotrichosporon cavernicola]BEI91635.1 hypothetical protein CcaverHIS019_0404550 [Cutaneotrichosporon cavernicola]BEI99411.1 hypothetical protein CcaverHIS631_0404540 [Cutaneotrichosporon cavernicola]BEJ07188.1 hypothetical protein CcaverHIS641_0404570 [Cutaneotrichosporon cavernicola]